MEAFLYVFPPVGLFLVTIFAMSLDVEPDMFYYIQIWRLCWPLLEGYFVFIFVIFHSMSSLNGNIIIREQGS